MSNLIFTTAQELATRIRQRQVSAIEVLEAHLAQIAQYNPSLNAIITLDEERAHKRATEADTALARGDVWGPLHGVPITIKDALGAPERTQCMTCPIFRITLRLESCIDVFRLQRDQLIRVHTR